MPADELDHFVEGVRTQQGVGLAIEAADADLEVRALGVDLDASHFEAEHLADEPAVLDDRIGTGGGDEVGEGSDVGAQRRVDRHRRGSSRHEPPALDLPDADGLGELRGLPGDDTGIAVLDDDVQRRAAELAGAGDGRAEGGREQPRTVLGVEAGVGEQRLQLRRDERGVLLRLYLAPLRWP